MKKIITAILASLFILSVKSQNEKFQINGSAWSYLFSNELQIDNSLDSITPRKSNYGHNLLDLGISVFPNAETEVIGIFRIRNETLAGRKFLSDFEKSTMVWIRTCDFWCKYVRTLCNEQHGLKLQISCLASINLLPLDHGISDSKILTLRNPGHGTKGWLFCWLTRCCNVWTYRVYWNLLNEIVICLLFRE